MDVTAADIMATNFQTLTPKMPLPEAIRLFHSAKAEEGKRIFGMMVVDSRHTLVGMLSMFDILLCVRPKHVAIWGEMEDIVPEGLFSTALDRLDGLRVDDLMSTELITITPSTHILAIIDIMLKRHVRRIPVVEDSQIKGIVYISDLFYQLLDRFMD
jgi:CBS domain-containing protein